MKFVIQRVTNASCTVDGNITGSIQKGFLVLIGISDHDTIQIADSKKGNRPSFTNAGKPDMAKQMYEYIIDQCKKEIPVVEQGIFGADMKISLLNDGPFTIILDSAEIC